MAQLFNMAVIDIIEVTTDIFETGSIFFFDAGNELILVHFTREEPGQLL